MQNGEPLGQLEFPGERLSLPPPADLDEPGMQVISATMTFAPFVVGDQPGKLSVMAETEDGVLRGPSLRFVFKAQPEDAAQPET
jgi:hypothetical protein